MYKRQRLKCDKIALLSYVCPESKTITGSRNMVRVMGHTSTSGSASRSASGVFLFLLPLGRPLPRLSAGTGADAPLALFLLPLGRPLPRLTTGAIDAWLRARRSGLRNPTTFNVHKQLFKQAKKCSKNGGLSLVEPHNTERRC